MSERRDSVRPQHPPQLVLVQDPESSETFNKINMNPSDLGQGHENQDNVEGQAEVSRSDQDDNPNPTDEIDQKPTLVLTCSCLLCCQTYDTSDLLDLALNLENSNSVQLNERLFNQVCKALKVKMGKRHSFDFKNEHLPFCSNCCKISEDLLQIEEQIRLLELKYEGQVELLKEIVIDSDGNRGKKQRAAEDYRFLYFRRQVTGTDGECRKSTRASDKDRDNSKTSRGRPKTKNLIMNALSEDDCNGEQSQSQSESKEILSATATQTPRRGRGRPRKQSMTKNDKNNKVALDLDSEDDNFEAICDPDEIDSDEPLANRLQRNQLPLPVAPLDDIDVNLKLEVQIKQELDSESGNDSRGGKNRSKLSHKRKSAILASLEKHKKKRLRKRYVSESERDSEDFEDSDFVPEGIPGDNLEDGDYGDSDEEEGTHELTIYRKWKCDKKLGKMWYDGIEVISLQNGLKCTKCDEVIPGDKKMKNKIKMKRHLLAKHIEKFACILCEKMLSAKKYLEQHIKMVHEKSVTILCDICEKPFTSLNAMRRHKWNHQNDEEKQIALANGKRQYGHRKLDSVQCGICGKMFKGPYNLKRHEETHIAQKDRLKHMCQICGALYSAPETLRSHIKLAHENNNRLQWLQCPECPKKFPQPGRLEKHMRCHTGEKPFLCTECGTSFSQPTLLKVHLLKHKNIRPHKCDHCDMSFFRRYHLQRHTQIYHESSKPPTKKQPYRSENGTRKAPQKRDRKKMRIQDQSSFEIELPGTGTNCPDPSGINQMGQSTASSIPNQCLTQNPCENVNVDPQPQHQLIGIGGVGPTSGGIGMGESTQNFSFTASASCTYPFTYTFAPHHQQ